VVVGGLNPLQPEVVPTSTTTTSPYSPPQALANYATTTVSPLTGRNILSDSVTFLTKEDPLTQGGCNVDIYDKAYLTGLGELFANATFCIASFT